MVFVLATIRYPIVVFINTLTIYTYLFTFMNNYDIIYKYAIHE